MHCLEGKVEVFLHLVWPELLRREKLSFCYSSTDCQSFSIYCYLCARLCVCARACVCVCLCACMCVCVCVLVNVKLIRLSVINYSYRPDEFILLQSSVAFDSTDIYPTVAYLEINLPLFPYQYTLTCSTGRTTCTCSTTRHVGVPYSHAGEGEAVGGVVFFV